MIRFLCIAALALIGGLPLCARASPASRQGVTRCLRPHSASFMPHLQPNELGRIPILEYHSIGPEPDYESDAEALRLGMVVQPQVFRAQLRQMYEADWYPVNMRDVLDARIRVPAGRVPVVLTFDDARPSQFQYDAHGAISPDSAVGILEAFHREHPDWPRRATFYVLPESKWNGVPFGQDGLEGKKLRFLVRAGYEVANHTTSHRSLLHLRAAELRWEMANCQRYVRAFARRATLDTMALPYGIGPSDTKLWHLLLDGRQGRTRYHHRCIVLGSGGPAFAPIDRRFNPARIPRVVAFPGRIEQLIQDLQPGAAIVPFVSDGDPATVTVPASDQQTLDRRRLCGARLRILTDTPPQQITK